MLSLEIILGLKETETANAMLFNLPSKEWKFWHPKIFIRTFLGKYMLLIPEKFTFKLFKKNEFFETIEEKVVTAKQLIKLMKQENK